MKPQLVVMLTQDDVTVKNAREVFLSCADIACACWGFKDVGLSDSEMKSLVGAIRDHGKKSFLEVVTLTEEGGLSAARLAIECGFDYLMGTICHESIMRLLAGSNTRYLPFIGRVSGHPSVLSGTPEEITADGVRVQEAGAHGVDILAYRNEGDSEGIVSLLLQSLHIPIVVAGSVNSHARLDAMKRLRPWAYTMGSALFERRFVPGGSFRDQLEAVVEYMAE